MSLRNELRGPHQNLGDWYKYLSQAALAIHNTSKNAFPLIIIEFGFD